MNRELTPDEVSAIKSVAERLSSEQRRQLLQDMVGASARSETPDGSRIRFDIECYERPVYRGQHSFGVQGELLDQDESKLSFDLFADENGRLLEMELIRWGEGGLISPDWSTLKLY